VDFFDYFAAVAPLLDSDSTLLAASAWNDNGMAMHVVDPTQLRRTDFFPGQLQHKQAELQKSYSESALVAMLAAVVAQ
jgi:GNT-I family